MDMDETASVIEVGQGQGRLSLDGRDLSCGDPILVEIAIVDVGWVSARVEWDPRRGWIAYLNLRLAQEDRSVWVHLLPGLRARRA